MRGRKLVFDMRRRSFASSSTVVFEAEWVLVEGQCHQRDVEIISNDFLTLCTSITSQTSKKKHRVIDAVGQSQARPVPPQRLLFCFASHATL